MNASRGRSAARRGRLALVALLLCPSAIAGEAAGACAGAQAAIRSAAAALDAGRWREAEQRLLPLVGAHADCGPLALELARLRDARGDPAGAETLFERATALAPGDARGLGLFAQHWLSRGQTARADYLSARALSLDPDCPEALVAHGRVLLARTRVPEAVHAFRRAVAVAPESAEAHYQLGVLFFRRQLHPDAVRELEAVVARRPSDARARDRLARSFEALGQPQRAEAEYRSALEVNERPFLDDFLDYDFGRFLLKQGRLDEARRPLDRAVALLPASRAARYERARLNLAKGAYAAARADAERALNLRDPDGAVLDLQVYYLLSTVYRRLGELELARKYAELARTTPIPGQD